MSIPLAPGLALLASLTLAPSGAGGQQPAAPASPRFERGPCRAGTATDERVDCGVLVPENREKAGSRLIRLPVVIFRSRAATPAPDPLVFVTGGPGNSNVARRRSGRQIPFLDERDYVVLEQGGAREAQPAWSVRPSTRSRARWRPGGMTACPSW